MATHDDVDLDARQGGVVGAVGLERFGDVPGRRRVAGGVVVHHEVVVDGLWDVEAAELVAGLVGDFVHDSTGVRRIVAADVEEVTDVVLPAGLEDALAVVEIGLVARGAQGGAGCAAERIECVRTGVGEIDQIVAGQPPHAVTHAEDLLDRADTLESLNDAGERRVDDGCGAARLADDRVAFDWSVTH